MATLNKFKQFFDGKSLEKGTNILLLWKTEGVLDVVAKTHPDSQDYSQACAHRWLVGTQSYSIQHMLSFVNSVSSYCSTVSLPSSFRNTSGTHACIAV